MDIIFYAGSLRPGGGLTVAKIMIEALAESSANQIVVYTGENDSSQALQQVFNMYDNVHQKKFFPNFNSQIRYALSKIYFLPKSLINRKTILISINYYIPTFSRLLVYHLNLLSFMRLKTDGFPEKIRELDASLACRFATLNLFESDYLKETAEEYTGISIRNPKCLYIGVDPAFFILRSNQNNYIHNADILLVSNTEPYKDNHTCIKTLKYLYDINKDVGWTLTVVGGQSVEQWRELKSFASSIGVIDKVKFLGPIDKKSLSKLMEQSLCLISASKVESFCMVALEAMASNCPAIVTNGTSMPESVGNAAIIVEVGSTKQFAESILSIYHEKGIRKNLIEKGRKRSKLFSINAYNQNINNLIKKISQHF